MIVARVYDGASYTREEVRELAVEAGFKLINLVWNKTGSKKIVRVNGFEDLIVEVTDQGPRGIVPEKKGDARFEPTRGGRRMAWIVDTPHNREVLASTFRFRDFTIVDDDIRASAEKECAIRESEMSPRERANYDRSIRNRFRTASDERYIEKITPILNPGESIVDRENAALKKKLEEANRLLAEKGLNVVVRDPKVVEDLAKMDYADIIVLAKQKGVYSNLNKSKKVLVERLGEVMFAAPIA